MLCSEIWTRDFAKMENFIKTFYLFIYLFIYLFWQEQYKWKPIVIIEITKLEFVRIKSFI